MEIKHEPDFEQLRKAVMRDGMPDRVPFYELFFDVPVIEIILGRPIRTIEDMIEFQCKLGYDYVIVAPANLSYVTGKGFSAADSAQYSKGYRTFNTGSMGIIRSWKDFEQYQWPDLRNIDFSPIERAASILPNGMKIIVPGGNVLELPMWILGYEFLSYSTYDDPDLVKAVFQKVGEISHYVYKCSCQIDRVGACQINDDLGFKTATMFSPNFLREHVLAWYSDYCSLCHEYDIPVLLHSCGNLKEIMDDIIATGIEAKHSFEDQIMPVTEAKMLYGDRIGILGGIDIDFLARASENEVRKKTRETLEICMEGGGYALGTGNSVANYIPVENILAMLDEGRKEGVY